VKALPTTLAILTLLTPSILRARENVVAYVPNWIDLKAFSQTIDYAKLTHINVAFENATNAEGDLSFNRQDDALVEKAHANHVQILVSIGGGSASSDKTLLKRYADLLSDAKRTGFVAKLATYVAAHNFDGLDVDLEGPGIGQDYGAFVADLSKALHANGKLITAAVSQGYGGDKIPDAALAELDLVNIMAYDGTGPWNSKKPGQHSSFDFAKSNVAYWLGRGVPKSKAVLGVPFYGYGFGDAFRKSDYSYSEIVATHPGAEKTDQTGNTIWYNGVPTIRAKTQYVLDEGLAGVMIWSLDTDGKGEQSLLSAIDQVLQAKAAAPQ